jgi:cold-inducible RNA-binding protein
MIIFVNNCNFATTNRDLEEIFSAFGDVRSVRVCKDALGFSRGFCFINMPTDGEAEAAIEGLDGCEVNGRIIKVVKSAPTPSHIAQWKDRRANGGAKHAGQN